MPENIVLFIDDVTSNIDDYKVLGEDYGLNVLTVELVPDIQELVNSILAVPLSAVVLDYKLSETRPDIKYTGVDVIEILEKRTLGLPKFILTTYPTEAEPASPDINIVYENDGSNSTNKFLARVAMQIEKTSKKLHEEQLEYTTLLEKAQNGEVLGIREEERLLELDDLIEKKINKSSSLPDFLKEPGTIKKLDTLLDKAKDIVRELENREDVA